MESNKKSILLIAGSYHAKADPNSICCEKVVQELVRRGHEVHIVSECTVEENTPEIVDGTRVYYYHSLSRKVVHKGMLHRVLCYLKWLWPFYKYPFTVSKKRVFSIRNTTERVLKDCNIDIVVCVHFPPETLIAVEPLTKNFPDVLFVSYMLDESSGGFCPRYLPERYCRKRKIRWENTLLKPFQLNVLMGASQAHHEKYSKRYTWYRNAKYLNVPLLGNAPNYSETVEGKDTIQVAFCGDLGYPRRNVPRILDVVEKQNDPKIRYVFAGESNCDRLLSGRVSGNVVYLGKITHAEVEDLLQQSDVFLNLGVTAASAISGKIFEYMSYGKPIISTYSIDNEACIPYLRAYPLSLLLDERNKVDVLAKQLSEFLYKQGKKRVSYEKVKEIFYQSTPEAFVDLIEEF